VCPEKAVCNSSPIILAAKIGLVPVLKRMFETIYIPKAVFHEITSKEDAQIKELMQGDFIRQKEIKNIESARMLTRFLGKGEVESILLSGEINADLLIIDDKKGRNYADSMGIKTIGIVGVIIKAYRGGLLDDFEHMLTELKNAGFWIREDFLQSIIRSVKSTTTL
jgi:predicted nucleic acid-binding protein